MGCGFIQARTDSFEQIHKEYSDCGMMHIGAKTCSKKEMLCALEREVAIQVYALYVLTPEEIKIVEGGESKH